MGTIGDLPKDLPKDLTKDELEKTLDQALNMARALINHLINFRITRQEKTNCQNFRYYLIIEYNFVIKSDF